MGGWGGRAPPRARRGGGGRGATATLPLSCSPSVLFGGTVVRARRRVHSQYKRKPSVSHSSLAATPPGPGADAGVPPYDPPCSPLPPTLLGRLSKPAARRPPARPVAARRWHAVQPVVAASSGAVGSNTRASAPTHRPALGNSHGGHAGTPRTRSVACGASGCRRAAAVRWDAGERLFRLWYPLRLVFFQRPDAGAAAPPPPSPPHRRSGRGDDACRRRRGLSRATALIRVA